MGGDKGGWVITRVKDKIFLKVPVARVGQQKRETAKKVRGRGGRRPQGGKPRPQGCLR